MPDFCTCGAELPPDSLFCHKCGKPQRELPVVEDQQAPPQPVFLPPEPMREPPPVETPGFKNPIAVRISMLVAIAATFLGWLPFINWVAGGFFAVFFYRRKTGGLFSVNAGLHLGWITGVMMFGMWTVMFATMRYSGQLQQVFQEQFKALPTNDPAVQQFATFLQSGPGLLVMAGMFFVLITCLSMAGGALGAKVMGRR
jgi:hypothetical protein